MEGAGGERGTPSRRVPSAERRGEAERATAAPSLARGRMAESCPGHPGRGKRPLVAPRGDCGFPRGGGSPRRCVGRPPPEC